MTISSIATNKLCMKFDEGFLFQTYNIESNTINKTSIELKFQKVEPKNLIVDISNNLSAMLRLKMEALNVRRTPSNLCNLISQHKKCFFIILLSISVTKSWFLF